MDTYLKSGKVYLRPHKAGKKWKPVWLSLFPPSTNGVGRLEIQDIGGDAAGGDIGSGVKHHQSHGDRKVKMVRLSELISVLRLPPNAEACPMENMSAFCVETEKRTMVFAALKDDCMEWVERLCKTAFQKDAGLGPVHFHMEENQIYASADDVQFWVVVKQTDAAVRCGLQGPYWLQVGHQALLLRETQARNIVQEWPYELLRRYGTYKLALTIEAGRRCESGPGNFTFETEQADKIFSLIQNTIKQKTSTMTSSNQQREGEKVTTNAPAHSTLPRINNTTSTAAILENRRKPQKTDSRASKDLERVSPQPAPITLQPLPVVPTLDTLSDDQTGSQSDALYADPLEYIHSVKQLEMSTALYVDPAKVLPIKPPSSVPPKEPNSSSCSPNFNLDYLDPLYSEVYDKISSVQNKDIKAMNQGRKKSPADDEPIYSEPMSEMVATSHKNDTKPDPFAHLYAHVCKAPSPSNFIPLNSSVSASTTAKTDPLHPGVIYENLGII
ncbi:docking protein 1-like [Thalassophryne amazonica]|uniref:docking protein 1-like n=1 Tax=Thalassophryne amazonica TaxID=390379 RepID=UPI0014714884|nr:docking protein 1-like [Thalassophryne amazonica]